MEEDGAIMRLAVYQPDIATNLGAMIRIAACFGVPMDVIEPCGFPLSSRDIRRVALDYGGLADLRRHDSWEAYCGAARAGRLVLLSTSRAVPLWDFAFAPEDTLMMGRESAGVPDDVRAACDAAVTIPMPGGGRSLNVSVAAGIALAEALRQTRAS
jgi:tRNA (cytidine/uridine-2'-O-)-methyltransferase